jgi:hypothetical protein
METKKIVFLIFSLVICISLSSIIGVVIYEFTNKPITQQQDQSQQQDPQQDNVGNIIGSSGALQDVVVAEPVAYQSGLKGGNTVSCAQNDLKGSPFASYKLDAPRVLKWYPTTEIAAAADPNYIANSSKNKITDCSVYTLGTDITLASLPWQGGSISPETTGSTYPAQSAACKKNGATWTQGNNANYPGCGTNWCCAKR